MNHKTHRWSASGAPASQLGGFRSDQTTMTNVAFQFQTSVNGASARVTMALEGW